MPISLIITILNEGQHLRPLLDSIAAQTRQPDQIVICDGGSTDDTLAVLAEYTGRLPLQIVVEPSANISRGRNQAIAAATGDVIAATDAGVWLEPDWLQQLVAPFESPGWHGALVAGFFHSAPENTFELALGATTLPLAAEIDPAKFLPSSRSVAYRREAWAAVGGYPEWLDYSEDVLFDLAIRQKFGPFHFVPQAQVHFRPRPNLKAFARQYFNYAMGDGKAGLWPRIHFIRYFTYLVAAPLGLYVALTITPWFWLLGLLAGLAYIRTPIQRLRQQWSDLNWGQRLYALALIPLIRVVGDLAKMAGYPVGVAWRWQRRTDNTTKQNTKTQ